MIPDTEKQMTPLSEAIERFKKHKQDYERIRDGWKPESKEFACYDLCVRIFEVESKYLESLLPKEKQMVEDAYEKGKNDALSAETF